MQKRKKGFREKVNTATYSHVKTVKNYKYEHTLCQQKLRQNAEIVCETPNTPF